MESSAMQNGVIHSVHALDTRVVIAFLRDRTVGLESLERSGKPAQVVVQYAKK
jgi:hypothetical protein